jgi:hypothetical protein
LIKRTACFQWIKRRKKNRSTYQRPRKLDMSTHGPQHDLPGPRRPLLHKPAPRARAPSHQTPKPLPPPPLPCRRQTISDQQSWASTPSCAGRTAASGRPSSTPARSRPPPPPPTTCSASSSPPRPLPTPPPASSPPSPLSPPTPPSSRSGHPPPALTNLPDPTLSRVDAMFFFPEVSRPCNVRKRRSVPQLLVSSGYR